MIERILHLIVVAGHAIFQRGRWYGGFEGEETIYARHVQHGVELGRSLPQSRVIFSGGKTRPGLETVLSGVVTNSEAAGLLEYARLLYGTYTEEFLLEPFGRDSFENVFFSLLAFYRTYRYWPMTVHLVSWPFKANRFYLIASGLRLGDGRFFFHGSGDLLTQAALEDAAIGTAQYDSAIVSGKDICDPLHRGNHFITKRMKRTPAGFNNEAYIEAVKMEYGCVDLGAGTRGVADVIEAVEKTEPGSAWRSIDWPWIHVR